MDADTIPKKNSEPTTDESPNGDNERSSHPLHLMPGMEVKAAPTLADPDAEAFVSEALEDLVACHIPFLLAGTFAISAYTGITRPTKDLDIFCKAGDYTRILAHFKEKGYEIEVEDDRWLGKVKKGRHFF